MNYKHSWIIVLVVLAVLTVGCGVSQSKYDTLVNDKQVIFAGNKLFAEVREAATGDIADKAAKQLRQTVSLFVIQVTEKELNQIVADKYYGDTQRQLSVLRDKDTTPDIAEKARSEFYRTLKASGRNLGNLHLTARAIDLYVSKAHARAASLNASTQPKTIPPKSSGKRPTTTARARKR